MLFFDLLEANAHLMRAGAWDEFENAAASSTKAIPRDLGAEIDSVDLTDYTNQLEAMLRDAATRSKKNTKALYWEFDVDNEWQSGIVLTKSFHYIETEWASDEQAWFRGPDLPVFGRLFEAAGSDPNDAVLARLVARTIASFGRAHERVGFHQAPVAASLHDSGYVVLMPRPGIDIDAEIAKAEAAYARIPRGEWIIADPRRFHLAEGQRSHDLGFGSVPGLLGTFWSDARGPWTPETVTAKDETFRDTYIVSRRPLLLSARVRAVLAEEATAADVLGWLEARVKVLTGEERSYWYPHFTLLPPVMVKAKVEWKEGTFTTWTVMDPEPAVEHRVLPFMRYAFDSWGDSLLIHRTVAQRLVDVGVRDFRWKVFPLTTDRRVREVVSERFGTEAELGGDLPENG